MRRWSLLKSTGSLLFLLKNADCNPDSNLRLRRTLEKDEITGYPSASLRRSKIELGNLQQRNRKQWEENVDLWSSIRATQRQTTSDAKEQNDNLLVEAPMPVLATSNGINPRIVGGIDTELQSFALHLRWDDKKKTWKSAGCGGTLISSCHVLTSAHCVSFPRKYHTEAIYVNAWRPFHNNTDGFVTKPYHISRILPELTVVHKDYQHRSNFNDIAILTLETCTMSIEPMEMADLEFQQNFPLENETFTLVAGFGRTLGENFDVPETLQSVDVNYIAGPECDRDYYPFRIQADMYCAGILGGGNDACQGDSGGPNYVEDHITGRKIQIGLISWGVGCADAGFPGVYTSAPYHYQWIKDTVCSSELARVQNFDLCGTAAGHNDGYYSRKCGKPGDECGLIGVEHRVCCGLLECNDQDKKCTSTSQHKQRRPRSNVKMQNGDIASEDAP